MTKTHDDVRKLVEEYEQESEAVQDALIMMSVFGDIPYNDTWQMTPYEMKRFEHFITEKNKIQSGKQKVDNNYNVRKGNQL